MSARKRSVRSNRLQKPRCASRPLLEDLENRLVLSSVMSPLNRTIVPDLNPGGATLTAKQRLALQQIELTPGAQPKMQLGPAGGLVPAQGPGPTGLTPIQLQTAYGIPLIQFPGGIQGNGAGQTIAVIDAGNNPSFQPTGAKYAGSALQVFDQTFGLPDPPTFGMYNQTGGTTLPAPVSGWGTEIALDIEWAHSIAPLANLEIVEASSDFGLSLFEAAETAVTKLGASVVSMSFGGQYEQAGAGSLEQFVDQTYFQPALAANPYVTFLASTGDFGANPSVGGSSPLYPSLSPNVVAVGGTTLSLTKSNQWLNEIGWSYGSDSFNTNLAGGGGISNTYPTPVFQQNDGFSGGGGFRTVPDVSSDADVNTGVSVYDPSDFGTSTPWATVGGTSLASPSWAGFIAIADQGRVQGGLQPLNGPTQTLPALYALPASDYHDETVGFNFYDAGPGYDLVTGRGSPVGNKLITDLSDYGAATSAAIEYQPPSSVQAGGVFGTVVEALDAKGNLAFGFSGTAKISMLSGPPARASRR